MRLIIVTILLSACAPRLAPPPVDEQATTIAIVNALLRDYDFSGCIAPMSLTVPDIPLAYFVEAGLSDAVARELIQGIHDQSTSNWRLTLERRVANQKDCLSVSHPILYSEEKFAYVLVADRYGQSNYIYERAGSTWKLHRTLSRSIH